MKPSQRKKLDFLKEHLTFKNKTLGGNKAWLVGLKFRFSKLTDLLFFRKRKNTAPKKDIDST